MAERPSNIPLLLKRKSSLTTCVHVDARSAEIGEAQTMLDETALPSHVWRRHGLPGRPDGGRATMGDLLHRPEVTLDQVPARPLGLLPTAAVNFLLPIVAAEAQWIVLSGHSCC